MITVKELKDLIAKADEDEVVFFYSEETDRDGYLVDVPVKIKKIKMISINENERQKYERWGY